VVKVVFLLAPDVHLLDLAGPAQAFGTVGDVTGTPWRLAYVAETATVISWQGMPLGAETSWPDLDEDDLVVVPGWRTGGAARRQPFREETVQRIVRHYRRGGEVMSVCAGAFALAEAGLLDGRRATTHHELQDELARRHPRVRVARDILYVHEGRIHTSAGIASGTDLALQVIAGRLGPRVASRVARAMVVYARRNGNDPQDSVMLRHRDHVDDLVHRVQDVLDEHFREPLPLSRLAARVDASERTVSRAFTRVVGMTPLRYQQQLRLEQAELLIGAGATVETAAVTVGFGDARMLRRLRSRSVRNAAVPPDLRS